jgi:hypothetical protein
VITKAALRTVLILKSTCAGARTEAMVNAGLVALGALAVVFGARREHRARHALGEASSGNP